MLHNEDNFLLGLLLKADHHSLGWEYFLQKMVDHFNLNTCHISTIAKDSNIMKFHIKAGVRMLPKYANLFVEKYINESPVLSKALSQSSDTCYSTNLSEDRFSIYESRFYKHWMKPQGIEYYAVACIFRDEQWTCFLASDRTKEQGEFTQSELDRISSLIPYIRKVYLSLINNDKSEKNTKRLKALVKSFRLPVAVFTELGELNALNEPMTRIFQDNDALSKVNGTYILDPKSPISKCLLFGVFQAIKLHKGFQLDNIHPQKYNDEIRFHYHELTHTNSEGYTLFLGIMAYAITLDYSSSLSKNQLSNIFTFTPMEADVCIALTKGYSIKEIAAIQNKSIHTVQEQVKSCLTKSQCSSQVNLINLLGSLPLDKGL